jgi:hypothetical protein
MPPFPFPLPTTTTTAPTATTATTTGPGTVPTTAVPTTAGPTTTGPVAPPGGRPPFLRENILVKRFKANATFKAAYDASMTRLRATLFGNGNAERILSRRADVLRQQADDLVDAAAIDTECTAIRTFFKTS